MKKLLIALLATAPLFALAETVTTNMTFKNHRNYPIEFNGGTKFAGATGPDTFKVAANDNKTIEIKVDYNTWGRIKSMEWDAYNPNDVDNENKPIKIGSISYEHFQDSDNKSKWYVTMEWTIMSGIKVDCGNGVDCITEGISGNQNNNITVDIN